MILYSMTATFGKLENQTLTLQPGLNVLYAPNEWGKSTWCAFLCAMLYGLDTRARSTQGALADKEHYAPWSGVPMSGRIELNWEGRDITIQRRTKGRIPLGDFSAFETATGLPVPELTAANCGQLLLGVERSVFLRAGFIRSTDLPVTQDEALRRRLNALVTTGDESTAGDELAQKLKDLKNKCRYKSSGLLPQAEAQREALQGKLQEHAALTAQLADIDLRQAALEHSRSQLENHLTALAYRESLEGQQRLEQAQTLQTAAAQACAEQEAVCQTLPSRDEAEALRARAEALLERQAALQAQAAQLPPLPQQPEASPRREPAADPVQAARQDLQALQALTAARRTGTLLLGLAAGVGVLLCLLLALPTIRQAAALPLCLGIALSFLAALLGILHANRARRHSQQLLALYPGLAPAQWLPAAQAYQAACAAYTQALTRQRVQQDGLSQQKARLDAEISALSPGEPLSQTLRRCTRILDARTNLDAARRQLAQARAHVEALQAIAHTVPAPEQPDTLTLSDSQTRQQLADCRQALQQLHTRRGQLQGKKEALGSESALNAQLDELNARILRLEQTYRALELALRTLNEAAAQLQRRFAPRIARRAQEFFSRLTDGRYDRLTLAEDLSVSVGAAAETTVRPALWRSEGTVDQLYLAVRLAVAGELTPCAPLILDDALAHYDDIRLENALTLLQEEAKGRQIIVFTCRRHTGQAHS